MILVEIATTTSPVQINPDQVSAVGDDANGARISMANGEVYYATATPAEVRHTLTQESF